MRCVDTDFLIAVLNDEPAIDRIIKELDMKKEYFTTVINQFELLAGAYQKGAKQTEIAKLLLSRFEILEFSRFSADEAGKIYAELRKKGQEIPMRDAMIAGIARVNGYSIITQDKHFKKVTKLEVINW